MLYRARDAVVVTDHHFRKMPISMIARSMMYPTLAVLLCILPGSVVGQSIVNSKHDLSTGNSGTTQWQSTNESQVCIFCHTPHRASQSVKPLWNHQLPSTTTYAVYNSSTMDATADPEFAGSPSLLCLSCHDGVTAVNAIANSSSAGTPAMAGGYTKLGQVYYPGSIFSQYPGANIGGGYGSTGGTDLTNDHPINIVYSSTHADVTRGKLHNPSTHASGMGGTVEQAMLFNGKIECSTCHNPHNPTHVPFLRKSNAGSDLCLTCHNK
jgi:predicted CXXCH cytochrome family protein